MLDTKKLDQDQKINKGSKIPLKMRHSLSEIDRIMYLIDEIGSFRGVQRQAYKEGIKLSVATISKWHQKYYPDYNSGNGLWKKKYQPPEPTLLNIYLNNVYKCIIKAGDYIPHELFENTPCTIKIEAVKQDNSYLELDKRL